jgi:hypothetical protein
LFFYIIMGYALPLCGKDIGELRMVHNYIPLNNDATVKSTMPTPEPPAFGMQIPSASGSALRLSDYYQKSEY